MNNNQGIRAYFVAPAVPAAGASLADADAPRVEEAAAADTRRTTDTEVGTEQTAQPSSSNEPTSVSAVRRMSAASSARGASASARLAPAAGIAGATKYAPIPWLLFIKLRALFNLD